MNIDAIKVTGLCDASCGKVAQKWYGRTNSAYCGDANCYKIIDESYVIHCKKVDEQMKFEKEMKDYGL